MTKRVPALNSETYQGKVRWPKYSGLQSLYTLSSSDAAKLLRRRLPEWTNKDHEWAAHYHKKMAHRLEEDWTKLIQDAHRKLTGKEWTILDYRISGVGSDKYPEHVKDELRHLAWSTTQHKTLAIVHWKAAGHRSPFNMSEYSERENPIALYGNPGSQPIIEKMFPSGGWIVSDIIGGVRVSRKYFGYSKQKAVAAFKRELSRKNNPKSGPVDENALRELQLYADNNADLYRAMFLPLIKNYARRIHRGKYQDDLAVQGWENFYHDAAVRYIREYGTKGEKVDRYFNKATRLAAAKEKERDVYEMIVNGEYDDYLKREGVLKPPLLNPRSAIRAAHRRGVQARRVLLPMKSLEVRYRRAGGKFRGQLFRHPYGRSVRAYGQADGSVILKSTTGKKLWGESPR